MTAEEKSKCRRIIHFAAASAVGVGIGMAQMPSHRTVIIYKYW